MAKRKKKAWNMTNPLYRYLHGGKKKSKVKIRKTKRRRVSMARKRKSSSSGSSFGGGKLSRGLFPVKGIIASMLVGAGIATLQEKLLPQVVPYQSEIAGFAVGGIGGAAGSFARGMIKGTAGGSPSAGVY
jgi:hypothetical protein